MHDNLDEILCHAPLAPLQALVESLEARHQVTVVRPPATCLTMIRAEDSLEQQEFYLGEALTTECELQVDGITGYGLCLGEEPVRAYCVAFFDALRESGAYEPEAERFLNAEAERQQQAERAENAQILRTQVDFKLLEQE
jgi:alpha-D-ribose 1-methylphosphonate 5-triphosphate synthase subunit PhnG